MNMERQMGGFTESNPTAVTNQMQMELAGMHGEDLNMFIETRAQEFRTIVTEHPEFLDEFEVAPEATLKKIEPLLYH